MNGSNELPEAIASCLQLADSEVAMRWEALLRCLAAQFGRLPSGIEHVLFLIGLQERGQGYEPNLPREEKQALIVDGAGYALATLGLFKRLPSGWEPTLTPWPVLSQEAQEKLLRVAILEYFARQQV